MRVSWVFDTGTVAHICNSKQELQNKWRLAKDEVTMRVRNGSKVDVIAVGTLPVGDITTGREPAYLGRVIFIISLKVIKQMKAQGL